MWDGPLRCGNSGYLPEFVGQPGKPGAHSGMGLLAVAAWWLAKGRAVEGAMEAAAAPAKAREMATMRMADFMIEGPFISWGGKRTCVLHASQS